MGFGPVATAGAVLAAGGIAFGIYKLATRESAPDFEVAWEGKSRNGTNSHVTGSRDPGDSGWRAKVALSLAPDIDINGSTIGAVSRAHAAVRGSGDFTDINLGRNPTGGLYGALNGMKTVAHTYPNGNGGSATYYTHDPYSANLTVTGTGDRWHAKVDVPFGFDASFDGSKTGDAWHIDVTRPGAVDIHMDGTGPVSMEQQLATAAALYAHN